MKLHSYALVHLHQPTCVGLGTANPTYTFTFSWLQLIIERPLQNEQKLTTKAIERQHEEV